MLNLCMSIEQARPAPREAPPILRELGSLPVRDFKTGRDKMSLYSTPAAHTPDRHRLAAACFARWGAEQAEQRVEWGRMELLTR